MLIEAKIQNDATKPETDLVLPEVGCRENVCSNLVCVCCKNMKYIETPV